MVHRAVAFANHDISDFDMDDPAIFLSNTWKLLPETNYALRVKGAYSVGEYRKALYGMMAFFRSLKSECVYHDFRGVPSPDRMEAHRAKVGQNLKWAIQYLRAKLLAVALIEAVAKLSGGDAPVSLFMGDLPYDGVARDTLLTHLPPAETPAWLDAAHPVVRLLRDGRLEDSNFDLRNSPLALWLYLRLTPDAWGVLDRGAESFFLGKKDAEAFLAEFPSPVMEELLAALAVMVPTRKERLDALGASLKA